MRIVGWEERLIEAVQRHEALPFAWGESDCFILPLDSVVACTGDDPGVTYRGAYDSADGARRVLWRMGHKSLGGAFADHLPPVAPALARRGDIGIADYPGAELGGGVVVMGAVLIGKGERGTVRLPRSLLVRAFKVGW